MNSPSLRFNINTTNLYQIADLVFFSAGDNLVLVHSKNNQAVRLLRIELVNLLKQCQEFKTLEDHIQSYYQDQQISTVAMRAMRKELQHLAQTGFLVSQSTLLNASQQSDKQDAFITSIVFPTCDRVKTLHGSIVSYIENCKRFERKNDFIVADDSVTPETRDDYRHMLRMLRSHYNINIAYAGYEEKMVFAKKLVEVGNIPAEIVSFALIGDKRYGVTTVGANRNALLLHTVGEIIFSSDDDILCQIADPPEMKEELVFSSKANPLEVWFFPDRESAHRSVHFMEQDILALHEQWLGKDPVSCAQVWGQENTIVFHQIEPSWFRKLTTRPGTIAVTLNGTLGDCSWDNPNYHLFQHDETQRRLISSEQAYRSARSSREMIQAVKRSTLVEYANPPFAMCMGLDNRELLPPFAPVGRAEEVVFGAILAHCFRATHAMYLAKILLHNPPELRTLPTYPPFNIEFNSLLPFFISLFASEFSSTPTQRLQKLGLFLEELGALPTVAFEELVRQYMWQSMSALVSGLEERLHMSKEPLPSMWQQDAKAFITQARQRALLPVKQLYQSNSGQEVIQHLLVQFGQVLHWWPAMRETASVLHAQGYRLAQPV